MQTIYRTNNITDAYLIKGLLEQRGIPSHITGEYLAGGVGELSARDFIYLRIDPRYLEAALQLMEDFDSGKLELAAGEHEPEDTSASGSEFEA
jgi:hypothetical protein